MLLNLAKAFMSRNLELGLAAQRPPHSTPYCGGCLLFYLLSFIDFRKDVTMFFLHASVSTFHPILSNFVKTIGFSCSAAKFIAHPFVSHAARPNISSMIHLAKFLPRIILPLHITSIPTVITIYIFICNSNFLFASSYHDPA